MLKVNNLEVNYGDFNAISDVSLNIEAGEIVALLGSNGAGKSTTINTLSGVTELVSGEIFFQGENISHMSPHERVDLGIVQVPEGRKLFPFMSVMDNLLIGSFNKHSRKNREQNLELCFEFFPILYERRRQLAGSMSGGEQQMCAIGRGLMAEPKLLMLDEPSLGLAPVIVETIFEIIKKINADLGTSILLVEQNVLASLEIAAHGFVLETGETVLQGTSEVLINDDKLKKAYLGI
ncbi:MAG: ABC transporter ATP-binding protein [Saccharofermentanales bacterium]